MKQGLSLQEMAVELDRQRQAKRDFIVDTRAMEFGLDQDDGIVLNVKEIDAPPMRLRPVAHQQFASVNGIPKVYYDRMLGDAPDLLATNLNHWLRNQPAQRMLRTIDGEARALLSDRYRPLDNYDLAQTVLPKLTELEAEVKSCAITEDRFYIKAVSPRIEGEVKQGDLIQAGIVVSNSEVGLGALRLEELDFRLVCLNGMIRAQAVRKAHLGRGVEHDAIEQAREFFRTETRELEDRAFWCQVQDATAAMFNPQRFRQRLLEYQEAAQQPCSNDPIKAVEVVSRHLELNETEGRNVLAHLIQGGDLSRWGLANAVTRAAEDSENYTRATELEAAGGRVIELPKSEWEKMN